VMLTLQDVERLRSRTPTPTSATARPPAANIPPQR
jgi:hypothetical protein